MIPEFWLNNKYGVSHVVAPRTAKYDIKVKGTKYRTVTWYHNYTGNTSYIKESQFRHAFRKGGYYEELLNHLNKQILVHKVY